MHVNGSGTCQGDGCNRRPVSGLSFCSEDHYEELVAERKSRNSYRTGSPSSTGDYTKTLKAPTNQVVQKKSPSSLAVEDLANVKLKGDRGEIAWIVVRVADVPAAPRNTRGGGRYLPLYKALKALPAGQAVKLEFTPHRHGKERGLDSCRRQLRVNARKDGLALMSSRNAEGTLGWFWLEKP